MCARNLVGGFIAALLFLAGCASPPPRDQKGSLSYMDAKAGFRGIEFGTPQADVVRRLHLEPLDGDPQTAYRRQHENLWLGTVPLADIRYRFLRNKFFGVTLVGTPTSSPSLLQVVQAAYGRGTCHASPAAANAAAHATATLCSWKGAKIEAEYKETAIELPVFSMWSAALLRQQLADDQLGETVKKGKTGEAVEAPDDL